MKVYSSTRNYIGALPNEVLSMIFSFVIRSYTHCALFRTRLKDRIQAPLMLRSVCRKWRAVAWHEPSLWSPLWVDPTPTGLNVHSLYALRANSFQSKLELDAYSLDDSRHGWDSKKVLDLVISKLDKSTKRIASLSLSVIVWTPDVAQQLVILEGLERLVLTNDQLEFWPLLNIPDSSTSFTLLRLNHLEISDVRSLPWSTFDFPKLRTLHLLESTSCPSATLPSWLDAVARFPNLWHLKLVFKDGADETTRDDEVLGGLAGRTCLSKLKSLQVLGMRPVHIKYLFTRLKLPTLESLSLRTFKSLGDLPDDWEFIRSNITWGPLQCLSLEGSTSGSVLLDYLLEHAASTQSLEDISLTMVAEPEEPGKGHADVLAMKEFPKLLKFSYSGFPPGYKWPRCVSIECDTKSPLGTYDI